MAINIIISLIGALSTFEISYFKNIGAVKSSAITTLIFLLALNIINTFYEINVELYSLVFFGSTFVGMSSKDKINRLEIVCSALIYVFVFNLLVTYFTGHGGLLGFCAFVSVALVRVSKYQLSSFNRKKY